MRANGNTIAPVATNSGKVRWGVLGVAKIATEKVIPAMQRGRFSSVVAIASRDAARAREAATKLGIATAHGSYEALISDPDVDAIYNPLPNHLHVPWTIRALEAGKHALCEKPIGLTVDDAYRLIDVRNRTGLKVQEAFMVRTHPQWLRVQSLVRDGRIGELRSMSGYFSYFNRDPANIRNVPDYGGGAMLDIGCYLVNTSRMIFEAEPRRVVSLIDRDPVMKVDRLSSLIMDFERGQSIGTCSTQVVAYQRVHVVGTTGRIEIEIPFNAPPDRPCRIFVDDGLTLSGEGRETIEIPTLDQYTVQGDLFSRAILDDAPVAYPLEDSILNMKVIEAAFRSEKSGTWEKP
jgi:predicted dehydrogenase